MSTTPQSWSVESERYYRAEERWLEDHLHDDGPVPPAEVTTWLASVLTVSDYRQLDSASGQLLPVAPPVVVFDVPDKHELAGWYDPADVSLHLHPNLTRKSLVLHELAHWIDPRAGHDVSFVRVFADLVTIEFGPDVAASLADCLAEQENQ